MIFDSFNNPLNQIKYPRAISETIEYLKGVDFSKLELGKHQIKGDDIFFNLDEYKSFPKEERIVEAHKEYVDIQFLLEGYEKIGYSCFNPENKIKVEYDSKKDLLVYEEMKNEFNLILTPGVFAIFFTEEPHRPCCIHGESVKVRKVVVKIRKSMIESL